MTGATDPIAALRKCPAHRVPLVMRYGANYCTWGAGHYPERWLELVEGREVLVGEPPTDEQQRHAWRQSVEADAKDRAASRELAKTLKPPPLCRPAVTTPNTDQPRLTPEQGRGARLKPLEEAKPMPVPKCSRCGGNGHNKRTCKSDAEAPTSEPRPRRTRKPRGGEPAAAPGSALELRGPVAITAPTAAAFEDAREQLYGQLAELDRAIATFDVIEKVIPKPYVQKARAVLEAVGVDFALVGSARQRVALNAAVAGVAATYYCATPPRRRKRSEILYAAASAIAGVIESQEL